jgi:hypothetical protein
MFRCDGTVFEIIRVRREGLRVVEALPEEVREWQARYGDIPPINLSMAEIRACYEGPHLPRCQRVAELTSWRFTILWGRPRVSEHYDHGRLMRWIGRAIPAPASMQCGQCTELAHACADCGRRLVSDALKNSSFRILRVAAVHAEPLAQLRAARAAYALEIAQPSLRQRRRTTSPWERP